MSEESCEQPQVINQRFWLAYSDTSFAAFAELSKMFSLNRRGHDGKKNMARQPTAVADVEI